MLVRVSELNSERVAEMSAEDMGELGIREGEAVRVKGKRSAIALAALAGKGNGAKGCICIGLNLQKRLGITGGSDVSVEKAEVPYAQRVQFIYSLDGVPGEENSFIFGRREGMSAGFPSIAKLAISALGYAPIRKGETYTITPIPVEEAALRNVSEVFGPEVFRALMDKPVYIKAVDVFPQAEALAGPDTEWNETDLKGYSGLRPDVSFEDVGGLEIVKRELRIAIEGPLKKAEKYARWGVRSAKGILLFGPPGCGKTLLAKAVAKELEAEFIYVKGAEIYNPYFGASEQIVRELFQMARTYRRSIIFWDEFDAVGTARGTAGSNSRLFDTILNAILVEMDGLGKNESVIVIAATNRADQLDPALKRPGRFDFMVKIPVPSEKDREGILRVHLRGKPGTESVDVAELARRTAGYTGADLENLVRVACVDAIEKDGAEKIDMGHLLNALANSRPSLTKEQVEYYEQMVAPKGQAGNKQNMFG